MGTKIFISLSDLEHKLSEKFWGQLKFALVAGQEVKYERWNKNISWVLFVCDETKNKYRWFPTYNQPCHTSDPM